jgi:hypothetical protein
MPSCNKCISSKFCDNIIMFDNKEHSLEKVWRHNKNDLTKDFKGKLFPYPKQNKYVPTENKYIIERCKIIHIQLDNDKNFIKYDDPKHCLLCNKKNVSTKRYIYDGLIWEDGLIHYLEYHNINLSVQFKNFVFNNEIIKNIHQKLNLTLKMVSEKNINYVMIEKKQLLILDAMLIHGGYNKKYIDDENKSARYSEHSGHLDFDAKYLSKIIVYSNANKIYDDIYFPSSFNDDMYKHEYIFHTHPPTPKPGGRAIGNILYEYPSISDIFHFIEHHTEGKVVGSLVITAEGLYNIRSIGKLNNIDEDLLFSKYEHIFEKVQTQAIKKYGTDFSTYVFYSEIAQETQYIQKINNILNKFNLQIDYYPRKKNINNKWVIDTVFLSF